MESSPFFSIVVPVYNRAHSLGATLKSVFSQSLQDYEVIVVDDGSSDEVDFVVAQYVERGLSFFRNEINSGVGPTRNKGVRAARGKWIIFLDSDNCLLPDALSILTSTIGECDEKVAVVYGKSELIGIQAKLRTSGKAPDRWGYQQYLQAYQIEEALPVARRDVLVNYPFLENLGTKRECGTVVWYAIGRAGYEFVWTKKVVQRYQISPDSLSGRNFLTAHPEEIVACNQEIIEHFGADLGRFNRAKLVALHQKTAFYCLMAGRRSCALHHALMARKIDPLNLRTWAILILSWIGPWTARRLYPVVSSVGA